MGFIELNNNNDFGIESNFGEDDGISPEIKTCYTKAWFKHYAWIHGQFGILPSARQRASCMLPLLRLTQT
jgi:hypothetical protein